MSIETNFEVYTSKRYNLTRNDVSPINVMTEMDDVMGYMVPYNDFLEKLQAEYNHVSDLKREYFSFIDQRNLLIRRMLRKKSLKMPQLPWRKVSVPHQ